MLRAVNHLPSSPPPLPIASPLACQSFSFPRGWWGHSNRDTELPFGMTSLAFQCCKGKTRPLSSQKIAPLPQFCSKKHLVLSLSHYLETVGAPWLSGYFTVSLPALAKTV